MKRVFFAALLTASLSGAPDPIQWTAPAPPAPVKAGTRFAVKLVAKIQEGWHLYGLKPMSEGPIPTRIWIAEGQPFALAAAVQATPPQTLHDPTFGMDVELYEREATFTLPVKIGAHVSPGPQKLIVNTSYQTCDNKICLPPKTVKVEVALVIAK